MPNWVYNNFEVSGTKEAVAEFRAKVLDFKSPFVGEGQADRFTFHAFITPPVDRLEEYHTTNGFVAGVESGNTEYNWYRFNNREWGTKWDACDVDINTDTDTLIGITFNTAWSPPMPIFEKAVEMFPELTFYFRWQEEQDWGGEASGKNGWFSIEREWDIPTSHEDYLDIGVDCSVCEGWYHDEPEQWYDDCPNKQEEIAKKEQNMNNQTLTITGTDVNVGQAVDAVINGEADLSLTYEYKSADMYGLEGDIRRVGADVEVETLTPITEPDLDPFRAQFPAIDVEVSK